MNSSLIPSYLGSPTLATVITKVNISFNVLIEVCVFPPNFFLKHSCDSVEFLHPVSCHRPFPCQQQQRNFNSQGSYSTGFNQPSKRSSKCEYYYMQRRGNGKSFDFSHNILNCPQMIAKFSSVNLTAAEEASGDSESEFAEFYDQSLWLGQDNNDYHPSINNMMI